MATILRKSFGSRLNASRNASTVTETGGLSSRDSLIRNKKNLKGRQWNGLGGGKRKKDAEAVYGRSIAAAKAEFNANISYITTRTKTL